MAPQSDGRGPSAKDVLEEFGKKIQEIATTKAHTHRNKLKGNLAHAVFLNGKISEHAHSNPCKLNYKFDTNVTSGKSDPCHGRWPIRFSDESRSQCTDNRIKDSTSDTVGACAPYRRLHLCDQNLEQIVPDKIKSTHNLLVDVLLAAKHEGKSLVDNHKEYKDSHKEFDSNICTILARSFADIGDIIRGKDLFLGGRKQEKKKLEANLKKLFEKLYEELKKHDTTIKTTYEKDGPDFYQLREDWWNANRQEVWKAITCEAKTDDKYNVIGPDGKITESNMGQCRNFADVPTNIDYVPQYLRWFDEWTEEFCRKRKKQLQNAIEKCRGENESGEPKYCSLNGCNCKTTVRGKKQFDYEQECTDCLVACDPFVHWIDNQELEFLKQKEKYKNEIKEKDKIKETKYGKINKIYAKEFYDQLKNSYGTVDSFLKLLNKEKQCENHPEVKGKTSIDFNDNNETFSHTEICEPCPWCGLEKGGPPWIAKNINSCGKKEIISFNDKDTTDISILLTNNENHNILEKLKDFCSNSSNKNIKMEKWRCHYDYNDKSDNCILQNDKKDKEDQKIVSFYSFFWRWVSEMLDDSIEWRTQLNKCIKNVDKSTCIKGCRNPCECFERWVEQKQKEWISIEHHFDQQGNMSKKDLYPILKLFLEISFMDKIKKAYGEDKTNELNEKLNKMDAHNVTEDTEHSQDAIKILLGHELEEAESCLKNQEQDDCSDEDSEDEDDDEAPRTPNPCVVKNDSKFVKVKEIAKKMHRDAKKKMRDNTRGSGGISKLRTDASKGTYKRGGDGSKLKGDKICDINTSHSNATGESKNPCHGKDNDHQRFNVGTPWKGGNFVNRKYTEAYIPPRRQHMCTSNLEYLETKEGPLKGNGGANVNASFLGDVLLAANHETENIKKLYEENNNRKDQEAICRAVRYSFADIGDIIRGRDMWNLDDASKKMDVILKNVFGTLHKSLDGIKDKYNTDEKSKPPYKQLREDWWEANRSQVWDAMQCALKSGNEIQCNNHAPYDDYIPQRLRWMTEWSEWYCKVQKDAYEKLMAKCGKCKDKKGGKGCMQNTQECGTCTEGCDNYKRLIDTWKKQWDKMDLEYRMLYRYAEMDPSRNVDISVFGNAVGEKDKPVVAFLQELQKANKITASKRSKRSAPGAATSTPDTPITAYSTAAGFIHQEAKYLDCNTQTQFCDKKNGEISSSDVKVDNEYAFREKPYDHDDACACVNNKPKPVPQVRRWGSFKPPEVFKIWRGRRNKTTCEIVAEMLKDKNEKSEINGCYPKNIDKKYNDWNCDEPNFKSGQKGACMPPRRQKLCVHYLEKTIKSAEQLKTAFVKCAAAETFLLWQYYKSKNGNANNLDNTLKGGNIPEEFKRQMFYTFADYRDLCLDTDLSSKTDMRSAVSIAKYNIYEVLNKSYQTSIDQRKIWWEKNGPSIWEGMLCALEKTLDDKKKLNDKYKYESVTFGDNSGPNLQTFSSRPQFLRWLTEWGEHFCKEQKKELKTLNEKCDNCTVSESVISDGNKTCNDKENCDACQKQCKEYQKWLKTWKEHYNKQNEKFQRDKENGMYETEPEVTEENSANNARDYLKTQLQNMKCVNGNSEKCEYKCMDNLLSTNSKMPKSMDDEPEDVKGKCNCVPNECNALSVSGSGFPDGQAFGGGVLSGKCKGLGEPKKKIEPPQYDPTNDILKSTIPVTIVLALGSIAFLFIKKKPKSPVDLLRVLDIHKGDYGIPTMKSKNRYIPYASDRYKGKTYIYMEGDSSGDEKYAFTSDTTDVTSSESEYEDIDINNIYPYKSPKYKTLIDVVLEPSKRDTFNTQSDIPLNDKLDSNKLTDEEWNQLKQDFISNISQNSQMDLPKNNISGNIQMDTHPHVNILDDSMQEKPFITSIHDRDLHNGEEVTYNINLDDHKNMNFSTNHDNIPPKNDQNDLYTGIDLINDSISGNHNVNIYDELLKRKENELFGTNHTKHTTTNIVAKQTHNDPIVNQINLFHKWLDRHRNMCEQWDKNKKEELLDKLKKEWEQDYNNNSGDIHTSDNNIVSTVNHMFNTDVSIQIEMDDPKPINQYTNMYTNSDNSTMDNILNDMEKYCEPYYNDIYEDDITYFDIDDDETPIGDIYVDHNNVNNNNMDVPNKVHIEMNIVNNKKEILEEEYPISDIWNI